ncbi:hypothetical protein GCM10027612_72700 [Microbispora bryophytorum subsp. camponoti]
MTSRGFCTVPKAGTISRSRATVCGAKAGSSSPSSSARSAMISDAPPEGVTTPIRGPGSGPTSASSPAVMMRSSSDRTRTTPSCRNAASITLSSPTSAPVCAWAVREASRLRPILSATIGLPASSARRAAREKAAGSRTDSRNSAMALVAGSSTR